MKYSIRTFNPIYAAQQHSQATQPAPYRCIYIYKNMYIYIHISIYVYTCIYIYVHELLYPRS